MPAVRPVGTMRPRLERNGLTRPILLENEIPPRRFSVEAPSNLWVDTRDPQGFFLTQELREEYSGLDIGGSVGKPP